MRVFLDARTTRRMSVGMTSYARQLAERLPRVAPQFRFEIYRRGGNFGIDEQARLPAAIVRSGARIVHFLSMYVPLVRPRPYAITIHDLIHLRFPHWFKRSVVPYYRFVVKAACAGAARVIVDDPRTSRDLERYLDVDPAKVRVIALGVDDVFREDGEAEAAPRPYFLYAGNHREHKNLATLAAAWKALPAARDADLWLTGDPDVPELVGADRARGEVRFLGEVTPQRLARLYRGAAAYVHPALCEGFGLPMLEAAASGTRVIASSEAVPHVLEPWADTFAPLDRTALGALLDDALERPVDPARRARSMEAARSYSWDRCAAATAEVYREMVADLSGQ